MKNLFKLVACVSLLCLNNIMFAQVSFERWHSVMSDSKDVVESVLQKECPVGMDINKFRWQVVNGEVELSESGQKSIVAVSENLKDLGNQIAEANNLYPEDELESILYSSFSPTLVIEKGELLSSSGSMQSKLNWNEVAGCALAAVGADVLWALGQSTASTWAVPMMIKAFKKVAIKVLGPIGVAITAVSFGLCLYAADQT